MSALTAEECAEEREGEREALESIFEDEYKVLDEERVQISVKPTGKEEGDEHYAACELLFTCGSDYPNVGPEIVFADVVGLSEDDIETLRATLNESIEESLGTQMLFNLVQDVKNYVDDWVENVDAEKAAARKREEEEQRRKEAAEELARRGTTVTRENFEEWRKAFEAERAQKQAKGGKKKKAASNRPSGRELFMTGDESLLNAVKYADDEVAVEQEEIKPDEALFADEDEDLPSYSD